jgi:N-acetyl-gamma-glutamyl-phosphate reductase
MSSMTKERTYYGERGYCRWQWLYGGEALRVLLRHPQAEVAWVTSRSPGPIEQVHPNLYDTGLHFVHLEEVKTPDFVMLALPTGASMAVAARFLKAGARVIDLGAAFCLQDRDM